MRKVALLALNSWQENLRNRFYMLALVFCLVLLYVSLIFGLLAVDQELRVLQDFGLALTELMGLAGALYGATTAILREMETKTIYLILTRPVRRGEYLLGRFAGLMLSVLASMSLMAFFHLVLLFYKGWHWEAYYLWAFLGAFLKVLITASLALFLALASSSVLTAGSLAAILWTLGHFLPEIRRLISEGAPAVAILPLTVAAYVLPDLQLFNVRDRIPTGTLQWAEAPLYVWFGYAALYSAVWLVLSRHWLRKKEL